MCERIKIIEQCYKALKYDNNKQAALNKISALHYELKFKDPSNFSDRFLQTASIIERNLSVFKSACDHVDMVTTILNHLYTVGVKLMLNDKCTADDLIIIYITYIVCKEAEIPCFLKAALINNSQWESVDCCYRSIISNCVYEMIVLDDSDLHAIISYLKITPIFLIKIRKIYVQESIKQKFLWMLKKNFQTLYTFLNLHISTFHTRKDLHSFLLYTVSLVSIKMVSIWSEDITAAKILASTLHTDITFINAHFEFCPNITFSWKWSSSMFDLYKYFVWDDLKYRDKIDPNKHKGLVYNLFYNGEWQKPVKNGYWVHNGNAYANATKEDVLSCVKSAEEASKSWSILPIVSRRKILEDLAATLECNGKFLYKNLIFDFIKTSYNIINTLKCHDERLEIISFLGSKGVISVYSQDKIALFMYMTLSLIIGNCVIVLENKNSCSLASYFNMFSTAGLPPGVVNLLSNRDMCDIFTQTYEFYDVVKYCTSINHIIFPLK